MNNFIYTWHHFTPHGKIWTQLIDLAPNVWRHNSVGRASHRYRGGHGFESRWSPDFFRLLLSSWLNWKICCDDHSSLSIFVKLLCFFFFYLVFTCSNQWCKRNKRQREESWSVKRTAFGIRCISQGNCYDTIAHLSVGALYSLLAWVCTRFLSLWRQSCKHGQVQNVASCRPIKETQYWYILSVYALSGCQWYFSR